MPQPLGRQAPPASVTSDGGRAWRLFQALLAATGAGVLFGWAAQHLGLALPAASPVWAPVLREALVWLAVLGVGAIVWRVVAQPSQTLAWDGQVWWLQGQAATPQPMLDLQTWLLLRVRTTARRPTWLALSAQHCSPAAWHGLRAALYSRAPSTSPPPVGGPPA